MLFSSKYKHYATCQELIVHSLLSSDAHFITLINYKVSLAKVTMQFLATWDYIIH